MKPTVKLQYADLPCVHAMQRGSITLYTKVQCVTCDDATKRQRAPVEVQRAMHDSTHTIDTTQRA
jgi:hypothetical protein